MLAIILKAFKQIRRKQIVFELYLIVLAFKCFILICFTHSSCGNFRLVSPVVVMATQITSVNKDKRRVRVLILIKKKQ